jgi:hypothetical protein
MDHGPTPGSIPEKPSHTLRAASMLFASTCAARTIGSDRCLAERQATNHEDTIMKTISTLAVAVSLALASAGAMASMANAATTMKKPAASTACVTTKSKPCPQKHASATMHKKTLGKTVAKKS